MKEKRLPSLFFVLFLLFLALPVWPQGNNNSRITVNQHTLNIVDNCDRVVMKGFQRRSKTKVIDRKEIKIEDFEEIEFQYVAGYNGHIMVFVRDKNNPKMASNKCMGFIANNRDIIAKSRYSEGECAYFFRNKTANTGIVIVCKKGNSGFSEFYVEICGDLNDEDKSDLHSITHVDFYEKGSATPSLKDVFLSVEDYSVNLFKYFMEKILAKYE